MNNTDDFSGPPKRITAFFRFVCHHAFYEELQGDLEERFYLNSERYGDRQARKIYQKEVLKMLRPSVVKKVKTRYQQNNLAMFKNYTLVAFRNLSRNRLFSSINIIGLAVSMAVGLLAIAFVTEMNSYDTFHENKDNIYRVVNTRTNRGDSPQAYATTALLVGTRLRDESTEFEHIVPIFNGFNGSLRKDQTAFRIKGQYVGADFLELFTFPLLYGNPQTALSEPNTVVLTEDLAMRVFSKKDVVGEIVEHAGRQYAVTGVMQQPPTTSHLKFDAVASLKSLEVREDRAHLFNEWTRMWSSYVYLSLKDGGSLEQAQESLNLIAEQENAKVNHFRVDAEFESLNSIFPGSTRSNQMSRIMPQKNIDQIVILALIVLFSACFNYANLSMARSMKRAKEVGVRKVVGARKNQLFTQFVLEAMVVSLISLLISILLFRLIRPEFIALSNVTASTTTLNLSVEIYLYFLLFALAIGVLAGSLPAILMTKFKTVNVIKGVAGVNKTKGINLRKLMIGVQFVLSVGFAILVSLAHKQYQFALGFDLGYTTENVVNVYLDGKPPALLKSAFERIPEIKSVSTAYFLHSTGTLNSEKARNIEGTDSATVYNNYIDNDYLENMGHELLAGENFREDGPANQAIVNKTLIDRFQLGSPQEAVGKQFEFYNQNRLIVGVIEDFHYGTLYNSLRPYAFILDRDREMYYMNVKLTGANLQGALDKMEKAWKEVYPQDQFNASFYSAALERTYSGLSASMKTMGLLAIVAISISILGLLGMAVYVAQARTKELTIRKVLGASLNSLVLLLTRSFLWVMLIAAAIAIPLAHQIFKKSMLEYLQYTITVGFWELAGGALAIIAIALLTISSQTFKAARTNPAQTLRNE